MLSLLPSTLAFLLSLSFNVLAVPHPSNAAVQSIPLYRRSSSRTVKDWGLWAKNQREILTTKYGATPTQKRSFGTNLITNMNADSSFYGSLAIGTPPTLFNVILDTGSSDFWIADASCTTGCDNVSTFDHSSSSSFVNSSLPFSIKYGSGQAAGQLGQDVVQMAGYSVPNQIFGICDQVSQGLLDNSVSGLIGLAFSSIAQSGATPFWETLASSGVWDSPLMGFHLTRFLDDPQAATNEPGGSFTMGSVDQSLFEGQVEFIPIPDGQTSFWTLSMTAVTIQGTVINLPSGPSSFSAIDTGTTLVGGPSEAIAAIYAQIPNSVAGTGNYEGYYVYPCATTIHISLNFGGSDWPVSNADFNLKALPNGQCLGAFFALNTGAGPSWIVGDTFLKNVYSVFRFSPPAVGFAKLSAVATLQNGAQGTAPTPTIGQVLATVVATSRGNADRAANGARASGPPFVGMMGVMVAALVMSLIPVLW